MDTQLNKPNHNIKKVLKVVKPTNKKTLGTSAINSPMSPAEARTHHHLNNLLTLWNKSLVQQHPTTSQSLPPPLITTTKLCLKKLFQTFLAREEEKNGAQLIYNPSFLQNILSISHNQKCIKVSIVNKSLNMTQLFGDFW